MRKLIALCALLLSASAAMAQADKAPAVTKLPGEEKLSVRERAERDFLMPIRHKKMAEAAKVTALANQDATAAPELDATAHYTEAAEARPEEVASPARAEHYTALRHHSRTRSVRHYSKATKTKATKRAHTAKHHAKATKTKAHRSAKKVTTHKNKAKAKKTVAKHTSHHATASKKAHKAKSGKKHRR